ncbi:AadS family aminoglycoside 6-adenylyltransferase [Longitalea arenae]|uniref:AadS family aminoglycoside 6-adenylyltransferase n=1 Tax=Longitalea arenae TaxID=2812558 RepID=UPI001967ADCB|nr:AadS family aminoglycoside 6-adenylyltransferase [Longitalea arenae]
MKARDEKLQQIIDWAKNNNDIRAALLTSSLVNPLAPVDDFSDIDIDFVFENIDPYQFNNTWLSHFGSPIAMVEEDETFFEGKHAMKMVLYNDNVKVDFKLYKKSAFINDVKEPELPEDWDVGYTILLDKDGITKGIKLPTYQSVLIKKPTEKRYQQLLNDFWWDMTYVAKCLARDELFYAKFMSENMMRTDYLVPLIEWYIASAHQWNITTNKHGRLFKKYVPLDLWKRIERTFSGSNMEENWNALFVYADIAAELGVELAQRLDYTYPAGLEKNVRKYLEAVKAKYDSRISM